MKLLLPLFALVLLIGCGSGSEADSSEWANDSECFSGDTVSLPLDHFTGKRVGTAKINRMCVDDDPDSINEFRDQPGAVSVALCFPELTPCKDESKEGDVFHLTFFVPPTEVVSRVSTLIEKQKTFIESKDGVDVYGEKNGSLRSYVSSNKNIFHSQCNEVQHGECDMMGVAEEGIQYVVLFHYQHEVDDWQALHQDIVNFIQNVVEFE